MGEARRRGTREERIQQALEKKRNAPLSELGLPSGKKVIVVGSGPSKAALLCALSSSLFIDDVGSKKS